MITNHRTLCTTARAGVGALALLLAVGLGGPAMGAPEKGATEKPKIERENIEWCDIWITEGDRPELKIPRVLLVGDSITRGYSGAVTEKLKGKAAVSRLATSKSVGDPALLEEIKLVLKQYKFDVIHFNNGLHGWGYSEADYRAHFPELLALFKEYAPQAKLIWATTTPVREKGNLKQFEARTERVKARNAIAAELTAGKVAAVDDLFGLVKDHPEYSGGDGVHYNPKGVAAEAGQVAKVIEGQLR